MTGVASKDGVWVGGKVRMRNKESGEDSRLALVRSGSVYCTT